MRPLNLATRPFQNERLPLVLLGAAAAVLLVTTLVHVVALVRLSPDRTSTLAKKVEDMDAEVTRLRGLKTSLRTEGPDKATQARWDRVKELVDRRTFSWTDLLSRLEEAVPRAVRLSSITPRVVKGEIDLEIDALAKTAGDGRELIRAFEARGDFDRVYPKTEVDTEDGVVVSYSMRYRPEIRPAAPAAKDKDKDEVEVEETPVDEGEIVPEGEPPPEETDTGAVLPAEPARMARR